VPLESEKIFYCMVCAKGTMSGGVISIARNGKAWRSAGHLRSVCLALLKLIDYLLFNLSIAVQ
jgi:hypothetical protein